MSAASARTRSPSTRSPGSSWPRSGPASGCASRMPPPSCSSSSSSWRLRTFWETEQWKETLRVEEECEPDDLAADNVQHLQSPRLVAVTGLVRLVLAERGRAVRGHGRNDLRAAALVTRPDPPLEDVVAAGEPHVEGRHRLRRVVVDERRQLVHVVALEGIDVAGEELGVRLVHLRRRVGADVACL